VVCHGAEGGRGCGRWSRWGWVAGSGSSCAPARELNWTRMGWQSIGQGTSTHMVLRWAVGFPKTMVVRPALLLLLLLLFYFLNSKCIRVSDCLGNCRIRVSVSFRYRYTYPYPCNIEGQIHGSLKLTFEAPGLANIIIKATPFYLISTSSSLD